MSHPLLQLQSSGLYCQKGDFYVDPWEPVSTALITHVHGDHAKAGSHNYFCSAASAPLMDIRIGREAPIEGIPYGEKRKFGQVWVSFHPAGHILGSAQIRIESSTEVWVVSGDYKRDPDPTCEPFEVLKCDGFITEATFGLPIYRWPPGNQVAREILDWWETNRVQKKASVLCCYALGKAQRILAELALLTNRPVWGHGAMHPLTESYRQAGVSLLAMERCPETAKKDAYAGELILAPPSAAASPWVRRFGDASIGFASGWMQVRGNRRRRGYDRGFVVSDHADWPSLIRTVQETGARQVLVTHGNSEVLSRYLRETGIDAQPLETRFGGEDEDGKGTAA